MAFLVSVVFSFFFGFFVIGLDITSAIITSCVGSAVGCFFYALFFEGKDANS